MLLQPTPDRRNHYVTGYLLLGVNHFRQPEDCGKRDKISGARRGVSRANPPHTLVVGRVTIDILKCELCLPDTAQPT